MAGIGALAVIAGIAVVFWVLPVWVGHEIGKPKHRAGGWWGLWLGWFGVIIVKLLPAKEPPREWDPATYRWKDSPGR